MKKAQDRQNNYADQRQRLLKFEARDHVFLKVTLRLRLKGPFKTNKSSPRYIGPYWIVDRVGEITYQLTSLPPLFGFHDVFHVSQLQKFVPNPFQAILPECLKSQ